MKLGVGGQQWKHGESTRQLANEWAMVVQDVAREASEADRCIARIFACDDPARLDERRGIILAELQEAIDTSKAGKRSRGILPQLLKLKAQVMGVMAPIKHVVAHVNADNPAAKLSNAELVVEILKGDPEALERTRALILGTGKEVVTMPAEPVKETPCPSDM